MTQSVFAKVKRTMDRAFSGEDVGPTHNLTYGDVMAAPTEAEIQTRIARVNWMRATAQERERSAKVADDFFAQDSSKRKWGAAIARAIRRGE